MLIHNQPIYRFTMASSLFFPIALCTKTPDLKFLNDRLFHVNTVDKLQALRFDRSNLDLMRERIMLRNKHHTCATTTRSMSSNKTGDNEVGIKDEKFQQMLDIATNVFNQYGVGYSEKVYQEAMHLSAYKQGIPSLIERPVHVLHGDVPLLIGRVDLEVDNRLLFELKIHTFNATNVRKDRVQIQKYLRAYAQNQHVIEHAALIYFNECGVKVVNVTPFQVNSVHV
jgi:GxxExxY protein